MNGLAGAILAAGMALGAGPVQAAGTTAMVSGSARAAVVVPIAAVEIADLDFGAIAASPARGGAVTVPAGSGAASYAGGARNSCNGAGCPAAHAALFAVRGEPNRAYAVWTPAAVSVAGLALSGGQALTLAVTGIGVRTESRPAAGPQGLLDGDGADRFSLGGTLQVPAGLSSAHYRVSVPVMLNYS